MKAPIKNMTVKPYGDDYMADAFLDFISYALRRESLLSEFKKNTGIDMADIINARGITAMVDSATGRTAESISKFGDWVTEKYWGLE